MWHAMSMKDAVKQWEQQNQQKISSAIEIKLTGICPSLDKMDTVMLSFVACEKLSLSSNSIERIANLGSMKFLRILSLGRNNIKSISGIEAVSETLEELWISYNQIEKLKGIGSMKKLKVMTISNNNIREWVEFMRLSEMASLKELVFIGNPLEERCTSEGIWRSEVVRRLPNLAKLDGHQCMATEVNLSDTQTELQKDKEEEDEENQEDIKNPVEESEEKEMEGDEENEDEETEDDDQLSQGNESNEENKEENKANSAELEESGNPVRQLNQVNDEPAVKEE